MLVVVSRGVLPFRIVPKLHHYGETCGNFMVYKLFRRKRATAACPSHIVSTPTRCGRLRQIYFRATHARVDKITFGSFVRVAISQIELVSNFSDKVRILCSSAARNRAQSATNCIAFIACCYIDIARIVALIDQVLGNEGSINSQFS